MKKFLIAAVMLFCAQGIFAQDAIAKTDVNKDIDLTLVYEQYVNDGYGTPAIYKKLANAHYFKNNYENAKKWYELYLKTEATQDPTISFRYKKTLRALKAKAKKRP